MSDKLVNEKSFSTIDDQNPDKKNITSTDDKEKLLDPKDKKKGNKKPNPDEKPEMDETTKLILSIILAAIAAALFGIVFAEMFKNLPVNPQIGETGANVVKGMVSFFGASMAAAVPAAGAIALNEKPSGKEKGKGLEGRVDNMEKEIANLKDNSINKTADTTFVNDGKIEVVSGSHKNSEIKDLDSKDFEKKNFAKRVTESKTNEPNSPTIS